MSYHEMTIQVDTEVDVGFDISVDDSSSGTGFDFDIDITGTDIEITIDTSDFRDEIKEEAKEEVKDEVKDELYEDIKKEIIDNIAQDANPFAKLAAFVNSMDSPHRRMVESRIDNKVISSNKKLETSWTNVCAEKDKEIEELNKDKLELADNLKLARINSENLLRRWQQEMGPDEETPMIGVKPSQEGEEKPALTITIDPPQPAFPNNTEEK